MSEDAGKPVTRGGLYGEREAPPAAVSERPDSWKRGDSRRHSRRVRRPGPPRFLGIAAMVAVALYIGATLWMIVNGGLSRKAPTPPPAAAAPPQPENPSVTVGSGLPDATTIKALAENYGKWQELLDRVSAMKARGLREEAVQLLEKQLVANPRNIDLKVALAQLQMELKQNAKAASVLLSVVQATPGAVPPRLLLAKALLAHGDAPAAYEAARWCLATNPGDTEALKVAARACLQSDWNEVAVSHLRRLLDAHPDESEARQLLAVAYLRLKEYGKAINHLLALTRSGSDDSLNYYNLAVAYAQQDQVNETIDVLTQASNRFGVDVVNKWLGNSDFEPVRGRPIFAAFRSQLTRSMSSPVLTMVPPRSVPEKRGVGLLPEPKFDVRPRKPDFLQQ